MTDETFKNVAGGATYRVEHDPQAAERETKKWIEGQFGPIPTGLPFNDVMRSLQGPPMMASVGAYPPPPPPEPPADVKAYLDKVAAEGARIREERRAQREAERQAEIEKALNAIAGVEIKAFGLGRIVNDYDDADLMIGDKGLIETIMGVVGLDGLEIGIVEVHIKFHGPKGKATP